MISPRLPASGPRARRLARRAWWLAAGARAAAAEVGPYRVHWVEAGEAGEPVVLLHGLSGSSRWWQRNLPALAARHRLLVPDVIGFGRSRHAGPLPGVPALAAALADWIDATGAESVHLVGHSMGGHLALHIAARHPERVRRLALVDAAGIPRPLTPRHALRFAWEVAPPRRWGDPRFLPVIAADAWTAGAITVMRGLLHVLRDDVRPLLPAITAPTLIVWGERDSVIPLEHGRLLREGIAGARLLVLKGAYHNPMVDRAADFDAAVLAFLAGEQVGE
jgi:pimeloyl-ACP methyl ester carboxylesterase